MNLLLRPLEDVNDPTWSVIISLVILLAGVLYYVAYILNLSFKELRMRTPKSAKDPEVLERIRKKYANKGYDEYGLFEVIKAEDCEVEQNQIELGQRNNEED